MDQGISDLEYVCVQILERELIVQTSFLNNEDKCVIQYVG
jgi:hypothetical protein